MIHSREYLFNDPIYSPYGGKRWLLRTHRGGIQKSYYQLERLTPLHEDAKVLILTPQFNAEEQALFQAIVTSFKKQHAFVHFEVKPDMSEQALTFEMARNRIQSLGALKIISIGWLAGHLLLSSEPTFEQHCGQSISFYGAKTLVLEDLKLMLQDPSRKAWVWKLLVEFFI